MLLQVDTTKERCYPITQTTLKGSQKFMWLDHIWSVNANALWCVPGNIPAMPAHLSIIHLVERGLNLLDSYTHIQKNNHPINGKIQKCIYMMHLTFMEHLRFDCEINM